MEVRLRSPPLTPLRKKPPAQSRDGWMAQQVCSCYKQEARNPNALVRKPNRESLHCKFNRPGRASRSILPYPQRLQAASPTKTTPQPPLTNDCVLAGVQAQCGGHHIHAPQLVLVRHVARQAQHGGVVQRLMHGQRFVQQVVLWGAYGCMVWKLSRALPCRWSVGQPRCLSSRPHTADQCCRLLHQAQLACMTKPTRRFSALVSGWPLKPAEPSTRSSFCARPPAHFGGG